MSPHAIADAGGVVPPPSEQPTEGRLGPERLPAQRTEESAQGRPDGFPPLDGGTADMARQIRERIRRRYYLNPAVTERIVDSVARDIESGGVPRDPRNRRDAMQGRSALPHPHPARGLEGRSS